MGRKIRRAVGFLFAIAAGGAYGGFIPADWKAAMNWAIDADLWVSNHAVLPGFFVLFATGGAFLFVPDLWHGIAWLRGKIQKDELSFPYVSTLSTAGEPLKNHFAFVENRKGEAILHLSIRIQDLDGGTLNAVFQSQILYQHGAPFVPVGAAKTLELAPGKYSVIIDCQAGSFLEFLTLRKEEDRIRREIYVYRRGLPGKGAVMSPILAIVE